MAFGFSKLPSLDSVLQGMQSGATQDAGTVTDLGSGLGSMLRDMVGRSGDLLTKFRNGEISPGQFLSEASASPTDKGAPISAVASLPAIASSSSPDPKGAPVSAGIAPFGAHPALSGMSPDDLAQLVARIQGQASDQAAAQQRPGSPDRLLFDRAALGGGLNPFGGLEQDGPATTGSVPAPAPTAPPQGMNPSQIPPNVAMNEGDTQRLERQMASPADAAALGGGQVAQRMSPVPGVGPSAAPQGAAPAVSPGTNAPATAPTAAQAMAVGAQAAAQQPGIFEKFTQGLGRPEISDLLINVGIGLMSKKGFGPGLAAGLQGWQEAQKSGLTTDLARYKLQQQIQGQNATLAFLKSKGMNDAAAQAAVLNPTVLSSVLSQMNQKTPEQLQAEARAQAAGSMEGGAKPIDRIQAEAQAQAAGSTAGTAKPLDRIEAEAKAQASGTAEGASSKPQYQKLKDEYGNERVFLVDQESGALKPVEMPNQGGGPGNPYATGKFNSDQAKAAGFSDRMLGSEPVLRKFETLNSGNALGATIANMAPNSMKSTERQQMDQAQRDFINSQLRRESGAAISPNEFESARQQYFPQPGDAPEVVSQKRRNRQTAIEAMAREGGNAYRPKSVFDEGGELVPFGERQAPQTNAQPSRAQLEAEARRRGLIK
jgi:hypothetical protein